MLNATPTIEIPEESLEERFVRASGPGGQNVNKVASAVELRFDIPASSLPVDVKARLIAQAQNRATARERLVELVRQAAIRPRTRRKTRPSASAREKRIHSKVRRSRVKARRGRVRGEE